MPQATYAWPPSCVLGTIRVSSKRKKKNFGSNRNKPKQDLFRVCFGLFRETKKKNFSVCFGVSNLYRNNRNKQNCFETNRNNPPSLRTFRLHETPQQAFTKFRNFCSVGEIQSHEAPSWLSFLFYIAFPSRSLFKSMCALTHFG